MSRRAVSCPSGEYSVVHQHDGNVVVYRNADRFAVWAAGTVYQSSVWSPETLATRDLGRVYGRAGRLELEEDGNLVIYCADDKARWTSGVGTYPPLGLMIHDAGRLVVMSVKNTFPWSSPYPPARWEGWNRTGDGRRLRRGQCLRNASLISDDGRFTFVVGEDTAVYLCHTDGPVEWAVPKVDGEGFELTADGRLVVRAADGGERPADSLGITASSAAELAARGAAELLVTDDGDLVIRDGGGAVIWTMQPPFRNEAPEKDSPHAPRKDRPEPNMPSNIPQLPLGEDLPVVRTDFSDDDAWHEVVARIGAAYDDGDGDMISIPVTPIDDERYANLTADQLAALVPQDAQWPMLAVADAQTMASADRHVLLVNLDEESRSPTARALPTAVVEIGVNLWMANMDWEDFAGDPDYGTYDPDRILESWDL
jgi:hypothetical protein